VPVARIPSEIPSLVAELLRRRRARRKNGASRPSANGGTKPARKPAVGAAGKSAAKPARTAGGKVAARSAARPAGRQRLAKAPARKKK
jgi:hypothetical protein